MKRVVLRAYTLLPIEKGVDMSVIETVRTEAQQRENIINGVSWSMDSDHLRLDDDGTGVLAVDLYPWIPGVGTSHDLEHYKVVAAAMFHAAQLESVAILWGGFWQGDKTDRPHFAKRRNS